MKRILSALACLLMTHCSGHTGGQGIQGESIQGPVGPSGLGGEPGAQGLPGVDASGVTVVQLCPGTASYGTFIEIGFCINSHLYATYSSNGGFSTEIFPGAYSSAGVNSSCSFTVGDNCTITH